MMYSDLKDSNISIIRYNQFSKEILEMSEMERNKTLIVSRKINDIDLDYFLKGNKPLIWDIYFTEEKTASYWEHCIMKLLPNTIFIFNDILEENEFLYNSIELGLMGYNVIVVV